MELFETILGIAQIVVAIVYIFLLFRFINGKDLTRYTQGTLLVVTILAFIAWGTNNLAGK